MSRPGPIRIKLPATSANLGPGFDALGLAMTIYLTIEAEEAGNDAYSIAATGRDWELCGAVDGNLILDTYSDVLANAGRPARALRMTLHNDIPLGMGCGSSAAALLAGVLLANHFGELGWTGYEAMEEASRREGHPDNVAACWLGWMTASAIRRAGEIESVTAVSCGEGVSWRLLVTIPRTSLSTEKARAMLPETYLRADAVANVQNTALLVAAFALNRGDLLKSAMVDRMHQPYRSAACPMLPLLLALKDNPGVLGVALSGAGPAVLLIVDEPHIAEIKKAIHSCVGQTEVIEAGGSKGAEIVLLR